MRRCFDISLIVAFLGITTGLGAWSLLRPADAASLAREQRTPAPRPPLRGVDDLKKLPGRFDEYFNDRLALRDDMLNFHACVKVDVLGVSSSPKVIFGRDGWLYFNEATEDIGGSRDAHGQAATWADSLAVRQSYLDRRGIKYVIALTPEKHEVHPEGLPGYVAEPQPASAARRLESVDGLSMIGLRDVLRSARASRSLYYRTDTHWNDDGAYFGYRALVEWLAVQFPTIQPIPRERFDAVTITGFSGDLARMLHLPTPPSEDIIALRLRDARARRLEVQVPLDPRLLSPAHGVPQAWGTSDKSLPRGIIFHDSFAEGLWLPLLAEHFETLVYAPSPSLDPALVELFRPHVVMQQIVERKINRHVPMLPAGMRK